MVAQLVRRRLSPGDFHGLATFQRYDHLWRLASLTDFGCLLNCRSRAAMLLAMHHPTWDGRYEYETYCPSVVTVDRQPKSLFGISIPDMWPDLW